MQLSNSSVFENFDSSIGLYNIYLSKLVIYSRIRVCIHFYVNKTSIIVKLYILQIL